MYLFRHLPLVFEVALVAGDGNDNVGVTLALQLLNPCFRAVEGILKHTSVVILVLVHHELGFSNHGLSLFLLSLSLSLCVCVCVLV